MTEDYPKTRSTLLAYMLWCGGFFMLFGLHRIYLKKYISGVFWFLTLGCLFIGQIIDFFWIPGRVEELNAYSQLRGLKREPRAPSAPPGKACPECGERIATSARICRHCHTDLTQPRNYEESTTISACDECGHILEVPNHLIGVPGRCDHCGKRTIPHATVM